MNENMETKKTNRFMALYESDSDSESETEKSTKKSTQKKNVKTKTKSAEMNTSYAKAAKVNDTDNVEGKWETVKKKKKEKKLKKKFEKLNNNYDTSDEENIV